MQSPKAWKVIDLKKKLNSKNTKPLNLKAWDATNLQSKKKQEKL